VGHCLHCGFGIIRHVSIYLAVSIMIQTKRRRRVEESRVEWSGVQWQLAVERSDNEGPTLHSLISGILVAAAQWGTMTTTDRETDRNSREGERDGVSTHQGVAGDECTVCLHNGAHIVID